MRKLLFLPALAVLGAGCSDSTAPSVPTSITIAPTALTFDAVGATQVVHATVANQNGKAMKNAELAWSSTSAAVTVTGMGGDSATVTSAGNGAASVIATSGDATGTLPVTVAQVATSVEKVSGDQQSARAGAALSLPVVVRVRDRLNAPAAGQTVTFVVEAGGGSITPSSVVTGADGIASATWTLGASLGLPQNVRATAGNASAAVTVFTAFAVEATISFAAGEYQAAIEGTAVPVAPSVLVRDETGAPIANVPVSFTVTAGGGRVNAATAITNAAGIATIGEWVLGPAADFNTLTASAPSVASSSRVFRGAGCTPGGSAYEISVCITTPMTASQRGVFKASSTRWSTIIKGDLPSVTGSLAANACGLPHPSVNMTYDDLLIFAAVTAIDGPGAVLGRAGPCALRTGTGGLPLIGVMEFDVADLANLESGGQLGSVILHEMGHVLGIGSIWNRFGLLQNPSSAGSPLDTHYSGPGGIAGFDAIGGTTYTGGAKVPVENTGGPGTMNGHWRETVLRNELMTGFINGGVANPLSQLTVRSLADLGYTVDPSAADPFSLAFALRNGPDPRPAVELHDDIFDGPRFTMDRGGRLARFR